MTKTVSPVTKFYKWKYSGLVVVPTACVIILLLWFNFTSNQEFFEPWSCETLQNYAMNIDVPKEFPSHNSLSESQHLHLHTLLQECQDFNRFAAPMGHDDGL